MDAERIRRLDLQCRARFTYLADPPAADTWRSHLDDVRAGRPWQGDCDDLASTVLDALAEAGVPLSNLYRLEVGAAGGAVMNHLIGCTWDDAGVCWIIGDTFGESYPATACRHRPFSYQRMDDVVTVREGAPWASGESR